MLCNIIHDWGSLICICTYTNVNILQSENEWILYVLITHSCFYICSSAIFYSLYITRNENYEFQYNVYIENRVASCMILYFNLSAHCSMFIQSGKQTDVSCINLEDWPEYSKNIRIYCNLDLRWRLCTYIFV